MNREKLAGRTIFHSGLGLLAASRATGVALPFTFSGCTYRALGGAFAEAPPRAAAFLAPVPAGAVAGVAVGLIMTSARPHAAPTDRQQRPSADTTARSWTASCATSSPAACRAEVHGITMLVIDGLFVPEKVGQNAIEEALTTSFEGLAM